MRKTELTTEENFEFFEETVVDERAIRRLAQSKGCTVTRSNGTWNCCGAEQLDDDEVWSVLQSC